jgi:hypothetical protein
MVVLHRLGIFSMGKVSAVYGALMGFLGGLIMTGANLFMMIIGGAARSAYSSHSSYSGSFDVFGIVTGLGAVICLPILYGIFGFIGGIISAFFINLALKFAGGLEMEATGFSLQPVPPPAAPKNITPLGPLPE